MILTQPQQQPTPTRLYPNWNLGGGLLPVTKAVMLKHAKGGTRFVLYPPANIHACGPFERYSQWYNPRHQFRGRKASPATIYSPPDMGYPRDLLVQECIIHIERSVTRLAATSHNMSGTHIFLRYAQVLNNVRYLDDWQREIYTNRGVDPLLSIFNVSDTAIIFDDR